MVSTLPQGGLSKHSLDELQSILAGQASGWSHLNFPVLTVSGASGTTTARSGTAITIATVAGLNDPGYRAEAEALRSAAKCISSSRCHPQRADIMHWAESFPTITLHASAGEATKCWISRCAERWRPVDQRRTEVAWLATTKAAVIWSRLPLVRHSGTGFQRADRIPTRTFTANQTACLGPPRGNRIRRC
jgi:hypothetical protein